MCDIKRKEKENMAEEKAKILEELQVPIEEKATLLAQTAYLQLPSSFVAAGVKVSVVFEDDVIDGIEEFRISDSDAMIYDLAGRRLGKTKHGINIVNGKKILVK